MLVSALLMIRRFDRALRRAIREDDFLQIFGAALTLIVTGTIVYTLGGDWSLVDGFYFAVATLTTSSIADPELVLEDPWLKVFTAFYVLLGIGILVETARRLGVAFIAERAAEKAEKERTKAAKAADRS
jgi:hypothetical protein